VKRALSYPLKLIAKNAGVNGSVVVEKVGNFIFTILFAFQIHSNFINSCACEA
jgi:chaperonin GroEL (HSP60 family)